MGDVLFSSTRWLQQDNLQEMGGPGRIKLARHASHGWKKEIGRVLLRNPEVFYVSGDSPQKDSLCREKKKKNKNVCRLETAAFSCLSSKFVCLFVFLQSFLKTIPKGERAPVGLESGVWGWLWGCPCALEASRASPHTCKKSKRTKKKQRTTKALQLLAGSNNTR